MKSSLRMDDRRHQTPQGLRLYPTAPPPLTSRCNAGPPPHLPMLCPFRSRIWRCFVEAYLRAQCEGGGKGWSMQNHAGPDKEREAGKPPPPSTSSPHALCRGGRLKRGPGPPQTPSKQTYANVQQPFLRRRLRGGPKATVFRGCSASRRAPENRYWSPSSWDRRGHWQGIPLLGLNPPPLPQGLPLLPGVPLRSHPLIPLSSTKLRSSHPQAIAYGPQKGGGRGFMRGPGQPRPTHPPTSENFSSGSAPCELSHIRI